ncbi:hypothetical protein LJB93_00235 [Desulfovibrio sp. OttesenSCG-928-F07]|nr:hypothetical protein [Desulfovibrio sp. OttesenSCG-928-F07]
MPEIKITCNNCGYEEILNEHQIAEKADNSDLTCTKCGEVINFEHETADAESLNNMQNEAQTAQSTAGSETKNSDSHHGTDKNRAADAAKGAAKQAAGVAKEKLKEAYAEGKKDPIFLVRALENAMQRVSGLSSNGSQRFKKVAVRLGHYAILVSVVISVVMGLLISIRTLTPAPLLFGLFCAVLFVFAQYLAVKGFALLKDYIKNNPSKTPHNALMDIVSAISLILAAVAAVMVLFTTVFDSHLQYLGFGSVLAVASFIASGAFLNHGDLLNIKTSKNMQFSEILIELIAAKLKSVVYVTPYVFGLGCSLIGLNALYYLLNMFIFGINAGNYNGFGFQIIALFACATVPFAVYLVVLVYSFVIDFARGLLKLGNK